MATKTISFRVEEHLWEEIRNITPIFNNWIREQLLTTKYLSQQANYHHQQELLLLKKIEHIKSDAQIILSSLSVEQLSLLESICINKVSEAYPFFLKRIQEDVSYCVFFYR